MPCECPFPREYYEITDHLRSISPHETDRLVDLCDRLQVTSVLDVGCGSGWVSLQLSKRGLNVTGIDKSQIAVNYAQSLRGSSARFFSHDIADPYPGLEQFDTVVFWGTTFGLSSRSRSIIELRRAKALLSSSGALLLDQPNVFRVVRNYQSVEVFDAGDLLMIERNSLDIVNCSTKKLRTIYKEGKVVFRATYDIRLYTISEIRQLLLDAGYTEVKFIDPNGEYPNVQSSRIWAIAQAR